MYRQFTMHSTIPLLLLQYGCQRLAVLNDVVLMASASDRYCFYITTMKNDTCSLLLVPWSDLTMTPSESWAGGFDSISIFRATDPIASVGPGRGAAEGHMGRKEKAAAVSPLFPDPGTSCLSYLFSCHVKMKTFGKEMINVPELGRFHEL